MSWNRDSERKAGKTMTIGGCIFGLVFSIFWCIMAVSMGAGFMLIFGIPFVGMMIYRLYVLLQMSQKEEPPKASDPWDRPAKAPRKDCAAGGYCPYCGSAVEESFVFCPKCGRKLK